MLRKRFSKVVQEESLNLPSLTSRSNSVRQLEAAPVRNVNEYRILDSVVGKEEGCESNILSREVKKFSISLIEPLNEGGSAIRTLGPV